MTINQLKYVLALYKHKNFTTEAHKSLVSQPSLSMQIQKLEKELNTKIFDRSKKPIETTEIGEKLIKQFQIIVSESLKVKDLINYQKNKIIGNLNIGISSTLESTILPIFTKNLLEKFPEINFKYTTNNSKFLYDSLNNNELDFVIGITPLNDSNLTVRPLYYEPILMVIPENFKNNEATEVELSKINSKDILIPEKENEFRNTIDNIFLSETYNEKFKNNSLETLVNLSINGNGIAFIPYLNFLNLADQHKDKVYKFKAPEPAREISVVFKNNNLKKHILEEVFLLLKNSLKKIQSFTDVKIVNTKI
ncbi:MAG: LysR substrate-binding domain-containing protein [Flavobacteriaceae bacterium]|nr:LysR substrate-binding domain-containing protein [Flavobacteriaceae bacterium]